MVESYTYHILLGGNLDKTLLCFEKAIVQLDEFGKITSKSKIYTSKAWGYESENIFNNQVIIYNTKLSPLELLKKTQEIEQILGREKSQNETYEDRVIDIDILFCGDLIIKTKNLTIPHSLMHLREFVLDPLAEISAGFLHPELNKTVGQLLKDLSDSK